MAVTPELCLGKRTRSSPLRWPHLPAPEGQRTESSKGVPQIVLVDEAVPVLVHDGEGLRKGGGWLVRAGEISGRSPRGWATGEGGVGFWDFQGTLKDIRSRVRGLEQPGRA